MQDLFGNEISATPIKRSCKEVRNDYEGFVEKFKPKKTTDDCYTPQPVYDAILGWVRENADIEGREIVRPFYPGGDYENYDYPKNCVVVDNPPFSIISRIVRFYTARNIPFFLFAPHLTLLGITGMQWTGIICSIDIQYRNGARIKTSFISNLFGDIRIMTAPGLYWRIKESQKKNTSNLFLKYKYPDSVVSAALLGRLAPYVDFKVKASECSQIRKLDCQGSKAIFGGGFLLSEAATARRIAAEQDKISEQAKRAAEAEREKEAERTTEAAKIVWQLSEREKAIIKNLE